MGWLPHFIETWTYLAIWLMMAAEAVLPIFPSEVVLPLGGLIASQGHMSLAGVILAGTLGSMTGAIFWYFLARLLGRARFFRLVARWGWLATVSVEEVARLEGWFTRFGRWIVLFGRLIPGFRSAVSIPAGLTRMDFPRFILCTAIGGTMWSALLTMGGWLLRSHYEEIHQWLGPVTSALVACAVLIWLARFALQFRRRRKARRVGLVRPSPSGEGLGVGPVSLTEDNGQEETPDPNPSPDGAGLR